MRVRTALVPITALVLALTGTGPANAARPPQSITVHADSSATGGTVTGSLNPHTGLLKVFIDDHTASGQGASITIASLRHGFKIARLLKDIDVQVGQGGTPKQNAASTRDINKIAVAYGGGDTLRGLPSFISSTVFLPHAGTYYVLGSAGPKGDHEAVLGRLHATGGSGRVRVSGTVVTLGVGSKDIITATHWTGRRGTIAVRNNGDSLHLLAISKVKNGVKDAQVQKEYANLMKGINPTPTTDPAGLLSKPTVVSGIDAISPGQGALLSFNYPAGTYLLQCFIADDTTGIPHTFMGMHKIVVLH